MSKPLFTLKSQFSPAGDQPKAIAELNDGIKKGMRHQTLFGVTGSGKTYAVANIIANTGKPTLVIAHNKTLAAQLAQEYREFFPDNAVHYFVSYYDYYQPEAYMPVTDTYIEKEAQINEEIDRLRHASTQALLTRKDVIIVASVSCIYSLGSPVEYEKVNMRIQRGQTVFRGDFMRSLIDLHFERTNADLLPGLFRAVGNSIEVMPVNEKTVYRIELESGSGGDKIVAIRKIDAVTSRDLGEIDVFFLFPAKHFITSDDQAKKAFKSIEAELEQQLKVLDKEGKILEAERLKRRTRYDLALIREIGYCNGIENYSRHFSGKAEGAPPDSLLSYFPHKSDGTPDFLTIIDESHVTIPQIGGMYNGDAARKKTLIDHGFRLPSARDNRPLKFAEFEERVGQVIYTSATPGPYEREHSAPPAGKIVEQVIRPTGLIDPEILVLPVTAAKGGENAYKGQIQDFIDRAEAVIKKGNRVVATTLTKKMAEDLSAYLKERNIKAEYLHSEILTLERIEILTKFRRGEFDCLVGVNLLREGLDLPELAFIGILDADKEGFLRSETSLIQIIGRAARNVEGFVVLYADHMTASMKRAIDETNRRRKLQLEYNAAHGITPMTIKKAIKDITENLRSDHQKAVANLLALDEAVYRKRPKSLIKEKEKQMNQAVKDLDFETAALMRDEIREIQKMLESKQERTDKKAAAEAKEKNKRYKSE